jgi:hypothetical protein
MRAYREGNKVIIECTESDCISKINTPEMVADALLAGMNVMLANINESLQNTMVTPEYDAKLQIAKDDFKERWEM